MNINTALFCIIWIVGTKNVEITKAHLPFGASTPSSRADQACELADKCIHDTILICGQMGEERRSFFDLCDMLEYGCDTNQIYTHVEDTTGCPTAKTTVSPLNYIDLAQSTSPMPSRRRWLRAFRRKHQRREEHMGM